MNSTSFATPMNRDATSGVDASQALPAFSDPRTIGQSSEIVREASAPRIPEALFIGENSQGSSYLLRRLQEKGFQCHFASTAENALSLVQAGKFDLVFCPIRLRDASLYFLLDLLDGGRRSPLNSPWIGLLCKCQLDSTKFTSAQKHLFVSSMIRPRLTREMKGLRARRKSGLWAVSESFGVSTRADSQLHMSHK